MSSWELIAGDDDDRLIGGRASLCLACLTSNFEAYARLTRGLVSGLSVERLIGLGHDDAGLDGWLWRVGLRLDIGADELDEQALAIA